MRVAITDRQPGEIPAGAVLMLPLFALPLGAWLVEQGYIAFGTCGMKAISGIPCLMCGATRGTIELLEGHLLKAITLQPLVIFGYAGLAIWGMVSFGGFVADRQVTLDVSSAEATVVKLAIIVLPFANWAYLIAAGV